MAKVYLTNQTPVNAEAMWNLKATLVLAGWTVVRGGRGTGRGYYDGSDPWATAANARGQAAWIVLESPDGVRQIEFQRYNSTADDVYYDRFWSMWYSTKDSGGFTGGTPDEDTRATAADEHQIFNGSGGSGWPATGTFRQQIMAEDAAPYGFWEVAYTNGGSTYPTQMTFFDPVVSCPAEDTDPVMIFMQQGLGASDLWQDGGSAAPWCHIMKGEVGGGFVRCAGLRYYCGANVFPFATQGAGANPHNTKDDVVPMLYARTSGQVAPYGYKGVSSIFKMCGSSHALGDALTIATTRDWLYLGPSMPIVAWNGDVPLV
jgi:hypothetical protein